MMFPHKDNTQRHNIPSVWPIEPLCSHAAHTSNRRGRVGGLWCREEEWGSAQANSLKTLHSRWERNQDEERPEERDPRVACYKMRPGGLRGIKTNQITTRCLNHMDEQVAHGNFTYSNMFSKNKGLWLVVSGNQWKWRGDGNNKTEWWGEGVFNIASKLFILHINVLFPASLNNWLNIKCDASWG